ncbi:hypothetical protein HK100_004274 [Physocladia obscura]|uniref:Major facilitator superfamily (MFS) profile domain-containing protein n=1 Tax=Physocladia obscura TaxID=109957 RepID=A0AAD5XFS8_9FUNG|nr:hypothetical protein HK100_004274 [Physocladia obscura]
MLKNAGITDSATQLWIGIGIDICSFLAAITGSLFFAERFGRRKMALSATFITVAAMLVMGLCTKAPQDDDGNAVSNKTATIFAVLAIYIVQIGFSGNWTPLQALYPTEIFNFSLRAKAAGITNVFWGTSGFLFNNVNPIGLGNLYWKYYMVQMVWNGVWIGFVYFLMVETKGRTLEQLDALFNKPNAVKESLKVVEPDQAYEASEKKVAAA